MTAATPESAPGILRYLYGYYAWSAFLFCAVFAALCSLVLPGLDRRRRWVGRSARAFFRLAGIGCEVRGLERLPEDHCVVVANHSSYLDGVILKGFLPPRFSYVIKSEMRNVPVAHFLLRRIGSRFVERFATHASARDARNLLRAADNGESLAFFPEGTFIVQPGLGRFRSGAFATAIKGSMPLVPVVIRGSRAILPTGSVLPRRGHLKIDVLDPVLPDHPAYAEHRSLAEHARQQILTVLDEPDLLGAEQA